MQIPKLQVLIEAGAVRDIEVIHEDTAHGWTVQITYASRAGERCEILERQRGGVRVFTTLDAVARCLAGLGLTAFRVNAGGLAGGDIAMKRRRWLLWPGLLWPALVGAWEEEPALAFILAYHPVVTAQRAVATAYQPPSLTRRVMEHTSVFVRAASGTSSTVSEGGDTTTSAPLTVGIQVNIPLASPREQREFTQQALAEATRIDEVRSRALTDLAKLRELEAEHAAVRERLDFHRSKADWIQERINKGYEGDVEKLWETAQQQNAEAAAIQRLDGLMAAQRRQVAHYAGEQWQPLLDYLSGKLPQLPEG